MKTKILVACPTKGRYSTISKRTAKFLLHEDFIFDFKFFIEPQDFSEYSKIVGADNIVTIDKNDQGLHYAKKVIKEYCIENNYSYVFKIDDDVNNIRVPEAIGMKGKKTDFKIRVQRLNESIEKSIELLDEVDTVKAVGFWDGFAWRNYNGDMFPKINYRLQSNYIIRVEHLVTKVKSQYYEDFVTFIQILLNKGCTVTWGLCALDVDRVGQNKGGLQSFNRYKESLEEYKRLKEAYPCIIWKKVDKKYEQSSWLFEPNLTKTVKYLTK